MIKSLASHQVFMRRAIAKAREGIRRGQTPFGTCIVRNGKIITCSHNAVWKNTDITAHAEITAIRAACKKLGTIDLSGCILYSTCEPCPMCFSACHWARISTVVYGAGIRDAKETGFNELSIPSTAMKQRGRSSVRLIGGILKKQNVQLFKLWLRRKDKRAY